jgi:hypothetical protein
MTDRPLEYRDVLEIARKKQTSILDTDEMYLCNLEDPAVPPEVIEDVRQAITQKISVRILNNDTKVRAMDVLSRYFQMAHD